MEIKKQALILSKLIKDNKNKQALNTLNKMIDFKSKKPNCCSNCSGHGFKGSKGCKRDSNQSWYTMLNQFKIFFIDHINNRITEDYELKFPVFKSGNNKHKFMNYSTIPVINCPGFGSCVTENYCYSLNSMRFPKATLSWLQNQILEDNYFNLIEVELDKHLNQYYKKHLKQGLNIDFRLYNDGDFSSLNNMVLWFNLLKKYPFIKAYGYTKSLHLIKELTLMDFDFPDNYKFNLSSGSRYDYLKQDKVILNNPCYRGKFISFNFEGKKISTTKLNNDDKRKIHQKFKGKNIFICPGVCNTCTLAGHACGSDKFKNVDIVIPIH
ncbi:MAG: hypothetical protein GOVbin1434_6 [Prokaryotic dsDNA virus sp.]|nr:MAG: hypothetical protein GOVbin1434_6 [Prokaryotic dsDNA virus sp.]|tara:strand:+ start:816 stop:1787 length:972 start_codon:yes stop_codon:yes gene_type:complete